MKVVVTGGAGFVGANLVRALVAQHIDVTVVDNFSTGYRSNLDGLPIDLFEGSILDPELLAEACRDASSIVHLAARGAVPRSIADPMETHRVNVTGTMMVLEAAREAGAHLIYSSSSSVYGANATLPKHEDLVPLPMSPYAASKLAAESYVLAYQQVFGVSALALRFFNIYGPLQSSGHIYAAVVPTFTAALLAGEPLPVLGDGHQTRDFTYVGSVVSLLCSAIERKAASDRPVNLAFGTRTSLLELVRLLEAASGRTAAVDHRPARAGDVRDSQADNRRLLELFPDARATPLLEGLAQTVEWFLSSGRTQP